MDRGSIGAGGRRRDAAGLRARQSGALPTVDQDQPADVFARRSLFPRRRRDRVCRAQGVRSRRGQREGRRGGDLYQRICGEGGGPTVTAACRTANSVHSRASGNPENAGSPLSQDEREKTTSKKLPSNLKYLAA